MKYAQGGSTISQQLVKNLFFTSEKTFTRKLKEMVVSIYIETQFPKEKILEAYEMKLHMYSDYIVRSQIFDDIMEKYPDDSYLQEQIAVLSSIDNRD